MLNTNQPYPRSKINVISQGLIQTTLGTKVPEIIKRLLSCVLANPIITKLILYHEATEPVTGKCWSKFLFNAHIVSSLPSQHGCSAFFSSHPSSWTIAGHIACSPAPMRDSTWPLTPPWKKIQRCPQAQISLPIPVTEKESLRVWKNSTPNSPAARLWQPCLKACLSKPGSIALGHYCVLKWKDRYMRSRKTPHSKLYQ